MQFLLKDIAQILNGEVEGDENTIIKSLGKIESASTGDISFLANEKYENHLYSTNASAVIIAKDFLPKKPVSTNLIKVQDPYSSFTTLLEEYERLIALSRQGIETPSFINEDAKIGDGHFIGAFAYVGKGAEIGENVKIFPQAYIGNNVKIGENTIIYPGAKIHDNSEIGAYCTIHANAVIGSDGFGFAPQSDGTYKTIPQVGNVKLHNHVNIGANTVVDCATMGSTIIHEGVKLDNLIQIGHNVEVGKHTVIAAQVGLSGSSKVGENCMIGGQVGVSGHIAVPSGTKIAAQAGVMSAPKEEGQTIVGSPTIPFKDYMRSYAGFKNLPQLTQRIEDLEEKILSLGAES